jgi:hypothetical protein
MGSFIAGLIVGGGGTLFLFITDEGELFLTLARKIKRTARRYKEELSG